jgi:hypothetical protein
LLTESKILIVNVDEEEKEKGIWLSTSLAKSDGNMF